jgi:serine/threonine-protein kinase
MTAEKKTNRPGGLVAGFRRLFSGGQEDPAGQVGEPTIDPRRLGVAFQQNGQLDEALECFLKLPLNESVISLFYELGLAFEAEGSFKKAADAYALVARLDPHFREIHNRTAHCKSMENTGRLIMPSGWGSAAAAAPISDDDSPRVMLGPYQVVKQIGKGAMGIVYLGRDPDEGRDVAIKTMALSQRFEEDEVDDAKDRFFHEARAAGTLSHPNIVEIFDAGEAHDLAFIVMEFLGGEDLTRHAGPEALLPLATVLEIMIQSAEGLDYAHTEGVVHRDIKPANIMYEAARGQVKLTDFGIARITASGRTKSGGILGTPSYMSPEQLAGKEVDGRSDLFSVGVTLYQLCTGRLPFQGDSIAAVMSSITEEAHPDILSVRPDLPGALKTIIDKALQKSADERYSRGADMVKDLRACAAQLSA